MANDVIPHTIADKLDAVTAGDWNRVRRIDELMCADRRAVFAKLGGQLDDTGSARAKVAETYARVMTRPVRVGQINHDTFALGVLEAIAQEAAERALRPSATIADVRAVIAKMCAVFEMTI